MNRALAGALVLTLCACGGVVVEPGSGGGAEATGGGVSTGGSGAGGAGGTSGSGDFDFCDAACEFWWPEGKCNCWGLYISTGRCAEEYAAMMVCWGEHKCKGKSPTCATESEAWAKCSKYDQPTECPADCHATGDDACECTTVCGPTEYKMVCEGVGCTCYRFGLKIGSCEATGNACNADMGCCKQEMWN